MPELPEVETIVRELRRAGIEGAAIRALDVNWRGILAEDTPAKFRRAVVGRRIDGVTRRGKFIILNLSGGRYLVVHLRMSGSLALLPDKQPQNRHAHLVLHLSRGRKLVYRDPRKFGRWWLVDSPAALTASLGPEPLGPDFSAAYLARVLAEHHRMIKPLLLDQHVVAGLGNIYTDEALWEARIHPRRLCDTLAPREVSALRRAVRSVLRKAIRNRGTSLGTGQGNYRRPAGQTGRNQQKLRVYHRTGKPCPRCGTPIRRIIVAQRSTHYCPRCQVEHAAPARS